MRPETSSTEVSLESVTSTVGSSTPLHLQPTGSHPFYHRWWKAASTWIAGPIPPREITFRPFFPALQAWPSHKLSTLLKTRRKKQIALAVYFLVWIILFGAVVHYSQFADKVNEKTPTHLACSSSLWIRNAGCGVDGVQCQPFDDTSFAFRCPSNCKSSGQVLNPRAVGETVAAYSSFVIGGPTSPGNFTYRADSFICPSAIHAGKISASYGGCGILTRTGKKSFFPGSTHHGLSSIEFPATFPSSYTFGTEFTSTSCADLRYHLFAVSLPFTILLSILCTHPATTFYALFTSIFFHVALGSDPPYFTDPAELVSRALSRFLPAAFVGYVLWTHVLRRTHTSPLLLTTAQIERTIFFLGGLWVGALTNITLEAFIPISRLTGSDLATQPGAKVALIVIIVLLALIICGQVYFYRLAGRLPGKLRFYAVVGVSLGLLSAVPGNSLRIHHYILALLLLPGTNLLTRPSLLYQGILLGLFINGIARWGFAGIIETPTSLIGDGIAGTVVPEFLQPEISASNITLHWNSTSITEEEGKWLGVSVLVNDVERVRWPATGGLKEGGTTIDRPEDESVFIRIGYYDYKGGSGDYTRAGKVDPEGEWIEPEEGRT